MTDWGFLITAAMGPAAIIIHYSFLCLSLALWVLSPPLTLSISICVSGSVLVFVSIPVFISLYRWPHLSISIVYFCLSLFLSHLSFDSPFLSLTLSLLSIYISMSLLSVNPGYNSMVESLEDSRFE